MEDLGKLSKEELLNGYLDGELSERQVTQVKRLIAHDEEFAKKVEELSRQRELLAAIPREKAPEHLLDDIKSRLERKVLLHEYTTTNSSYKSLVMRHLSSLAAVIVLVLGLGFVIWQVVSPVKPEDIHKVALLNDNLSSQNTAIKKSQVKSPPEPVLVPQIQVMDKEKISSSKEESKPALASKASTTTLDIRVDNIVTANKVLAQAVYSNSLLDEVMVKRSNTNVEYTISAPAERVADFFTKAKQIWSISRRNELILRRGSDKGLYIDNVTYPELQEFILHGRNISLDDFAANIKFARELDCQFSSLRFVKSQCNGGNTVELLKQQMPQRDISLASRELMHKKKLSFKIKLSEEN